ncbi:efflux RND transporter periplasmic adaptor subunit [Hankyongella ginsenosidimutans]|uniref:efflux RND transporter periplasmic adaptor subunit n=1 Tax=Hankyongella ginsenosidimutans TaxID=1763828 RepID=UPI001CA34F3E|nr:biotin/lipoyl-binding protein [Hankyongella ginsenosidimutans]
MLPIVKEVQEWDEYTGRFEAYDFVEVRSRVNGYLQSIHFTDGDIVEKGQLLFQIDPRPFQVALDQAKARLTSALSAQEFAKDLERARELLQRENIPERVFDQRQDSLKTPRPACGPLKPTSIRRS